MTQGRPAALSLGLYAAAFVLVLVSGGLLAAAVLDELRDTGLLWISAASSVGAAVLAFLSLVLPKRAGR